MKIVVLNAFRFGGGAAKSANLISAYLEKRGVDVSFLSYDNFAQWKNKPWWFYFAVGWEKLKFSFVEKSKNHRFGFSSNHLGYITSQIIQKEQPDLIHIHWVGQSFVSIKGMGDILKLGVPVVWTMHDEWAYTGGCHYTFSCQAFTNECGNCVYLKNGSSSDISHSNWMSKKKYWPLDNLTLVTPSSWLAEKSLTSKLFSGVRTEVINNPRPSDGTELKPKNDQVFIVGAVAADLSNIYKGGAELKMILKKVYSLLGDKAQFVLVGEDKDNLFDSLEFPIEKLGYLKSEREMFDFLDRIDCFCISSLQENYPNVLLEAGIKGVPIAGFDVGGICEIAQKGTGLLSAVGDTDGVANSIQEIYKNRMVWAEKRASIRQNIIANNAPQLIADKYYSLFENLLN